MEYYDTAQICLNGHMVNDSYNTYPQYNQDYCSKCGAKTITTCPNCNAEIRGDYKCDVLVLGSTAEVQAYCYNCGKPYPWTTQAIESAQELINLEESVTEDDKKYFQENLQNIIIDTPNTKIVATRLKLFLKKACPEVVSALRDIIVDIGSETAKKIIFG